MALSRADFSALKDRRVALVYSFPKPSEPSNRWYDRWRTRVIMSYGEALERIGVVPYYCDIDTFIQQISTGRLGHCDAVMSLNAGVRPVSHFALVPAVAQWFRKPIIPCTADTIMAGERKDLGNALASRAGLRVPRIYRPHELVEARNAARVVIKPRDLGGSFGLRAINGKSLEPTDFDGGKIVQEFVFGYDVTIPVFVDASTGELTIGDATVYVPSQSVPTEWIYDRDAKEAYVGGSGVGSVVRKQLPLEPAATQSIREYCSMIGVDCFARVDFRLQVDELVNIDRIKANNLAFIEINPMPTVCVGLAFVESVRSWVVRNAGNQSNQLGPGLAVENDYDIIAFVLGHALLRQLGPAKMDDRDKIGS